jgi:hypothetical protein
MRRALGEAYCKLGEMEAGEQVFKQLVADDPTDVWNYTFWGDALASRTNQDYAKARKIYEMGVKNTEGNPDHSELFVRLENLPC